MDAIQQPSLQAALKNRLNYLASKQGVVSGNIANANTPNYLAKDITFEKVLSNAQLKTRTTQAGHLQPVQDKISTGRLTESRLNPKHNGNTVQLDEQMIKMNEIQLQYRLMTSLKAKHSAMQRMALGSGAVQ